ncbi:hypothetical protein MTP09_11905 [Chryseobacterium suipulveris]|uniref:Cytochrome C n=1 Tax=Chryseobacterium suipulveris TaxID=2929800 RepID=A0ABY4BN26_9FLAO|nr:hypothetical protein [Chryseobacterium suipulveris]UOE40597.1 hypothetical protein MTP09_11905 [Chryseobacterium suipulveris]
MKKIVWFAAAILLFALTSCREQENLPYFHKEDMDTAKDLMMNRNSSEDSDSVLVGLPQENAPNVKPPIK